MPVEIITRREPRRSWTVAQKREIVAESLGPDLKPSEVARKHSISSGQLYTWRQQLLRMPSSLVRCGTPRFSEVELDTGSPQSAKPKPPLTAPSTPTRAAGLIEVVLPSGAVVRVDAHVDVRALRRILGMLEGR